MPNTTQQGDILYKKLLGIGTTQSGRKFFEEPVVGRTLVIPTQIWIQAADIPYSAPAASSGVVQKLVQYQLTAVGGTSNSFTGALFTDIIPFNWGNGTGYDFSLYDSTNAEIAFGVNDWTVDTEAGILMFNDGVPENMPPKMSFYRYSGQKGITGSFVGTGQTGQFYNSSNPSNYIANSGFVTGVDNVGGWSGLFSGISGNKLEFKTISGGSGILISGNAQNNGYVISVTGIAGGAGGGEVNTASNLGTGSGIFGQKATFDLQFKSIKVGPDMSITGSSTELSINLTGSFARASDTGNFITTSQTGAFASTGYVNNVSGVIDARLLTTGLSIASWTGQTPTQFYPSGSNPSGYITGISVGKIIHVDSVYGNDGPAARERYNKPFLTITGAVSSATSGDVVLLGPGVFDLKTGQVLLPPYVHLMGRGMTATTIYGNRSGVNGAMINPGTGSHVSDFTLRSTGVGYIQIPIGAAPLSSALSGSLFTDVIIRNIKVLGDSDGLLIGSNKPCVFSVYDSIFDVNYDAVSLSVGTGTFNNCNVISRGRGVLDPSFSRGVLTNSSGTINFNGGSIASYDGEQFTYAVEINGSKGFIHLSNTNIVSSSPSGEVLDINNDKLLDQSITGTVTVCNTRYLPIIKTYGIITELGPYITTGAADLRYYPLSTNPSGYVTGLVVRPTDTGAFVTTSQTGQFAPAGLTGSFITTSQTGQFAPAGLTGSFLTSAFNAGGGSGVFSGLSGSTSLFRTISGGSGIQILGTTSNNLLVLQVTGISGGGSVTNNNTNYINSGTGSFVFRSDIASGVSSQYITYPSTLDSKPIVIATLHNDINPVLLALQVSGANPTGFYAILSNTTTNTGYYVDVFATTVSFTGSATNVIVYNTTINSGGGGSGNGNVVGTGWAGFVSLWTGTNAITGDPNFVYSGGKVGIGYSTPTHTLQVSGVVKISAPTLGQTGVAIYAKGDGGNGKYGHLGWYGYTGRVLGLLSDDASNNYGIFGLYGHSDFGGGRIGEWDCFDYKIAGADKRAYVLSMDKLSNNAFAMSATVVDDGSSFNYGFRASAYSSIGGNMVINNSSPSINASNFVVNGNAVVGSSYYTVAAPTNGLLVEGNVGIGMSNPAVPLHVNGVVRTSGNILISGQSVVTGVTNIGAGSGLVSGLLGNNNYVIKSIIGGSGIQVSGSLTSDSLTLIVTGVVGTPGTSSAYDVYTARFYV